MYAEGSQFHSFKKVLTEMGPPYAARRELASFHSISRASWASACEAGWAGSRTWAMTGLSSPPGWPPGQPCLDAPSPRRCGFRGGYVEVVNMDAAVKQQMQKLRSVRLCPPTPGRVLLDVAVSPPAPSILLPAQFQAVRVGGAAGVAAPRPGLA